MSLANLFPPPVSASTTLEMGKISPTSTRKFWECFLKLGKTIETGRNFSSIDVVEANFRMMDDEMACSVFMVHGCDVYLGL